MAKIGLAMGGGGAKGMAHLGFLKVLNEEGIKISAIAGTSIGAIIGGLYALEPDDVTGLEQRFLDYFRSIGFKQQGEEKLTEQKDRIKKILEQSIDNIPSLVSSFLNPQNTGGLMGNFIPDALIEDTKIPFAAVASDLVSGKDHVFRKGPMKTALIASSTVPGLWPPYEYESKLLVDGGTTNNVPVQIAKELGAEKIIAVDVRPALERPPLKKNNRIDILARVLDIAQYYLAEAQFKKADLVIRPNLESIFYTDFTMSKICIALGEKSARIHLNEIKSFLKK